MLLPRPAGFAAAATFAGWSRAGAVVLHVDGFAGFDDFARGVAEADAGARRWRRETAFERAGVARHGARGVRPHFCLLYTSDAADE